MTKTPPVEIPIPFYEICNTCGERYGTSSKDDLICHEALCMLCGEVKECAAPLHYQISQLPHKVLKKENVLKWADYQKQTLDEMVSEILTVLPS